MRKIIKPGRNKFTSWFLMVAYIKDDVIYMEKNDKTALSKNSELISCRSMEEIIEE